MVTLKKRGTSGNPHKQRPGWYYDACTLDQNKAYFEMFNRRQPRRPIISHLALGEAYANISHKKGAQPASAFIELMQKLSKYVEIVGNDDCDDIFDEVRATFPGLHLTDALHVATAIHHGCEIIRTSDSDIYNLVNKGALNNLGRKHGLPGFAVVQM